MTQRMKSIGIDVKFCKNNANKLLHARVFMNARKKNQRQNMLPLNDFGGPKKKTAKNRLNTIIII